MTNQSRRPIRILGATRVCGHHGCLDVEGLPLDIPPLSQRNIVVFVKTRAPGEFGAELTLFSDSPGQSMIVLTVNGRVIEE
jgi:ABC-type molybdate transport system permease subunit